MKAVVLFVLIYIETISFHEMFPSNTFVCSKNVNGLRILLSTYYPPDSVVHLIFLKYQIDHLKN